MIRHCLAALIFLGAGVAAADETVPICYGYGCIAQAQIKFSDAQLEVPRSATRMKIFWAE